MCFPVYGYGDAFVTFQAFIKKINVLGVVIPLANSYGYGTYSRTVQYTVPVWNFTVHGS
jgi:hypothetical protein